MPPATTSSASAIEMDWAPDGHGLEARSADLVEGVGRRGVGQAGLERRQPGDVLPAAGLEHVAQDHVAHGGGLDARPGQGFRMARAPSWTAFRGLRAPPKVPTAVRVADRM